MKTTLELWSISLCRDSGDEEFWAIPRFGAWFGKTTFYASAGWRRSNFILSVGYRAYTDEEAENLVLIGESLQR